MKLVGTIVIALVVIVAALVLVASSMCMVGSGIDQHVRVVSTLITVCCLGVIIGGMSLIIRIHREP
jgi:hypothetical protein